MLTRRRLRASLILGALACVAMLIGNAARAAEPLVSAVDSVGITVNDMERSVDFYARVLTFAKVSDREVAGDAYEHLYGVFGLRLRIVRMRLVMSQSS